MAGQLGPGEWHSAAVQAGAGIKATRQLQESCCRLCHTAGMVQTIHKLTSCSKSLAPCFVHSQREEQAHEKRDWNLV